jgi:hypothetical protein
VQIFGPGAERRVSVRSTILSLRRFEIADPECINLLEKHWAAYRKENGLNIYSNVNSGDKMRQSCDGSDAL